MVLSLSLIVSLSLSLSICLPVTFQSYLIKRKLTISISGYSSNPSTLRYTAFHFLARARARAPPHPRLSSRSHSVSSAHTHPLSQIPDGHSVSHGEFAIDSQLNKSAPREYLRSLISNTQSCAADVKVWMTQNKLQLNDGKAQTLLIDPQNSPNFHFQS